MFQRAAIVVSLVVFGLVGCGDTPKKSASNSSNNANSSNNTNSTNNVNSANNVNSTNNTNSTNNVNSTNNINSTNNTNNTNSVNNTNNGPNNVQGQACANENDVPIITEDAAFVREQSTSCAFQCIEDIDTTACAGLCISDETGLSEACGVCFGELVTCSIENCFAQCTGDDQEACAICQADFCQDDFILCAGIGLE